MIWGEGWYNYNRNKLHDKCNAFESSWNHPLCLLVLGKMAFHETNPWCQKSWGPLSYQMSLPQTQQAQSHSESSTKIHLCSSHPCPACSGQPQRQVKVVHNSKHKPAAELQTWEGGVSFPPFGAHFSSYHWSSDWWLFLRWQANRIMNLSHGSL